MKTETATSWVDSRGIAHIEATGVASTTTSVEATMGALRKLLDGRRAPLLFDARRWSSSDTGGWVPFISLIESVCLAGAVLIYPQRPSDLGNHPSFVARLLVPSAVFTDEAEALVFLESHVEGPT